MYGRDKSKKRGNVIRQMSHIESMRLREREQPHYSLDLKWPQSLECLEGD